MEKKEARMQLSKESFYDWAYSDLLVNNQRGHFAEYLVAVALGITDQKRLEWDPYDLLYGNIKIEIKSAAYVQSWEQNKHSLIGFDIKPTKFLNLENNHYEDEYKRQSDVYVFCHLKHKDKETINPEDVTQWDFFIAPTAALNEKFKDQKRVSLSVLKDSGFEAVEFNDIKNKIDGIFSKQ